MSDLKRKIVAPKRLLRMALILTALALFGFSSINGPLSSAYAQSSPRVFPILFSADGINFASKAPDVFSGSPRLAPGSSVTAALWVKNTSSSTLLMNFKPQRLGSGIEITVRSAKSTSPITLPAGRSLQLSLAAALPVTASNDAQGGTASLLLNLDVSEVAGNVNENPESGSKPPGSKPPGVEPQGSWPPKELGHTGFNNSTWLSATALLLAGALAYLASRRRKSPASASNERHMQP